LSLVPDDCPDDFTALEHFQQVFYKRYGSPGPDLYMGPLDQAIKDSLHKEIREVLKKETHSSAKLLIFYSETSTCHLSSS